MKKLFLVPIIHTPADMGTLGNILSATSAAALGKELWNKHQTTVSCFWDSVSRFFDSLQIRNLKIYQDGLIAAGEDGLKIVSEGVRRGSANYRIISGLLGKGAVLIKTEDIALVRKEYDYIQKLTSAKSAREREAAGLRYRLDQAKLLADRDRFIAGVIENTLNEGDTGVLFIGAYHDVLSKLSAGICVVQIKEVTKVREYHRMLADKSVKTKAQYQQLAEYLAAPVSDT
jgi:hypothetical protein